MKRPLPLIVFIYLQLSLSAFSVEKTGEETMSPAAQRALSTLWGSKDEPAACELPVSLHPAARLSIENEISFHSSYSPQEIARRVASSKLVSEDKTANWKISIYSQSSKESAFSVILRPGLNPLLFEGIFLHPTELSMLRGPSILFGVTPEHRLVGLRPYEPPSEPDAPELNRSSKELVHFYEVQVLIFRTSASDVTQKFYEQPFSAKKDLSETFNAAPMIITELGLLVHRSPNYVFAVQIETGSGFLRSLPPQNLPGFSSIELPSLKKSSNLLTVVRASGETVYSLTHSSIEQISTTEPALPVVKYRPPEPEVVLQRPRLVRQGVTSPRLSHGEISVQEIHRGGRLDLNVFALGNTETYQGVRAWYFLEPAGLFLVETNNIVSFIQVRTGGAAREKALMVRTGSLEEYVGDFTRAQQATFQRTVAQPLLRKVGRDLFIIVPSLNRIVIYKATVGAGQYLKQWQLLNYSEGAEERPQFYEIAEALDVGFLLRGKRYRLEQPTPESEGFWRAKGPLPGTLPRSWRTPTTRGSKK
jgi:hypothetical protein